MQVKARVALRGRGADARSASDEITVIRTVHYHQYDTYFFFDDPAQGRLRYREDELLDATRQRSSSARARLTLTGPSREAAFGSVLLFRSRFFAPATHSPRFYREYFRPAREREVEKDRRRWLVAYPRRAVLRAPRSPAEPAGRRLFPRSEVAHLVAARRAGQGRRSSPSSSSCSARGPDEAIEEGYVEL